MSNLREINAQRAGAYRLGWVDGYDPDMIHVGDSYGRLDLREEYDRGYRVGTTLRLEEARACHCETCEPQPE